MNRKYLMANCQHLLDTQKRLNDASSSSKGAKPNTPNFSLASFLGECGAAGLDDYDDVDGGLWMPEARHSAVESRANCRQDTNRSSTSRLPNATRTTRKRSWVIPYTAKVVAENESKHPAIRSYRNGKLLDHHSSQILR